MAYIKFNKEESERLLNIPKETLDLFIKAEYLKINEDNTIEVDENAADIIGLIATGVTHNIHEESELPDEIKDSLLALAKTYSETNGDINLKTPIHLDSRESNVIAFYVYNNWIYLLDDEGSDIDPISVEVEFLEKFIEYISDTNNILRK